jgi:hypothetical protein
MSLEILKEKTIHSVATSQNGALLKEVLDLLSGSAFPDEHEIYYKQRLEASIQQAEAGQLTPSSEIHQAARKWIIK